MDCGLAAALLQLGRQRREVVAACPRRARARPPRRSGSARPPPRRARRGGPAVGAEAGLDRVRRAEHERVGAGAVAVGHDRRRPGALRDRRPARSAGRNSGVSPGTSSNSVEAVRQRVLDADLGGLRLARLHRVREHDDALAACDGLGGPVGRDHGDLVEPVGVPERAQDIREHGLRQGLRALRRRATRRGAALRHQSFLLEESRASSRAFRTGRSEPTGCRAPTRRGRAPRARGGRAPPGCPSACRSRARGGPPAGSSATTASITSSYARAMPAALRSIPAHSQNASVGPLSDRPPTNGLTATTGARCSPQRLAHPGQGEDRADRDHRVRRADHDRVGLADGLRAPRRRAWRARSL